MKLCVFEVIEKQRDGTYVLRCGGGITRVSAKPKFGRTCDCGEDHSDCGRRGEELRREVCDSCQGPTQIKVFACAVHGECTLGKQLEGIKCCAACGEYAPPAQPGGPAVTDR